MVFFQMLTRESRERVEDWASESEVDSEAGIIRNVLYCGNESLNGYSIPPEAFRDAARVKELYEGVPVFLNHTDKNPRNRDVRDAAGIALNPRFEGGRPRGDILAFKETDAGKLLLAFARSKVAAKRVGFSHVGSYQFNDKLTAVESVKEVVSLDLVTSPATTKTLYEQDQSLMTVEMLQTELATVRTERDSFKLKAEEAATAVEAATKAAKDAETARLSKEAELADLKAKLDVLETKEKLALRREAVNEELKAAGLDITDKVVCTEHFLSTLYATESAETRKAAIEDRVLVLEQVSGKAGPTSKERKPKESKPFAVADVELKFA